MFVLPLSLACSESAQPSGAGSASLGATASTSSSAASTDAHFLPLPNPLPSGPTHYRAGVTPPANAGCKPLPTQGPATYAALAKAVRRLACEPALFLLTAEQLRVELALPPTISAEFGGASAVSLRFPKGNSTELAQAMGVAGAVAARRNAGAWGWRIWDMVTEMKTRSLEHWGPGILNVGVDVDDVGLDDKVDSLPLEKSTLDGVLTVSMPESVLPVIDDDLGSRMLINALQKLAQDKARLGDEPADQATALGLAGERFRVSRRTQSSGADSVKGVDFWTARTQIAAGPVIAALGLPGRIQHNRAHDTDDYVLYDGKQSEFAWRGLKLEFSFEKRAGEPADGAHGGWLLRGITVMP